MKRHLLTLYTRTPLHVGSGTSVEVVDLPIMRERITNFPVIPSTSLKGVLRDAAGSHFNSEDTVRKLFGEERPPNEKEGIKSHAGCIVLTDAKLLAFPVRSLAGCFAWLTCPVMLARFNRDTGFTVPVPSVPKDKALAGDDVKIPGQNQVVLEEYAIETHSAQDGQSVGDVANKLKDCCSDELWVKTMEKRLVILNDENFQHFVTTCTEIVARISINPATRTNTNLFNQENVPCETLFYSVAHVFDKARKPGANGDPGAALENLLSHARLLQLGGDETTGHGFCEIKHQALTDEQEAK